ncbi:MAG TPA: hypothetical protein VNO30_13030 [Kofleriaceae bacterium]|nr:hypothetical protein [Kofleriaceae bacterium]
MQGAADEDEADDELELRCQRCPALPHERPLDRRELGAAIAPAIVGALPDELAGELVRCVRCLAHDGVTIDRAHVDRVHELLGPVAEPLAPWLAERAVVVRPELAGAGLLVAEADAVLIPPAEVARQRLDALASVDAPDVLIAAAREALVAAEAASVRVEWERVHAWPAPARFAGTVAFGEIARILAEHTIPPLLGPPEDGEVLGAIAWVIPRLVIDEDGLEYRHQLAAMAAEERAPRRAEGLRLAVRFLDELGRTDLRDSPDTLVDDCYLSLRRHGQNDAAARVYRVWLEVAVPRAWTRAHAAA